MVSFSFVDLDAKKGLCETVAILALLCEFNVRYVCQASSDNNTEVVMKWLESFAIDAPTQLETKGALMAVGVDSRLCPASMCKEELEA